MILHRRGKSCNGQPVKDKMGWIVIMGNERCKSRNYENNPC